ncbi:hypothetical protein PoB_007594000 [Plakobranchus ocellatus]|uniref:Uncharacterized protein n=1 Tax=Plakobranchus ocellatus TaxID=259542 RepID=A0AAV4DZ12_9GAST|nr:hypothetical protein PoB_007594000 [Plakobranchus ocellatus]
MELIVLDGDQESLDLKGCLNLLTEVGQHLGILLDLEVKCQHQKYKLINNTYTTVGMDLVQRSRVVGVLSAGITGRHRRKRGKQASAQVRNERGFPV